MKIGRMSTFGVGVFATHVAMGQTVTKADDLMSSITRTHGANHAV
ncbi:hypothetical protein PC129_g23666 [Phytophthora cactorum]|uniref:Uncharacterized protein n=1 Tax=Phytophthora cactorum TaxID=29920 RepID=A0A8T1AKX2_9STRA|nr:hypothetical protein PC113_g23601 [Phytophthora cactorum]KAG2876563.1 hypothetical protein PC115_g23588 [Phytophthora cactorum]KAG2881648.1 hypothetical protein PC117_g26360 [Phytophthora cactorum]KAG2974080.1 hypothetical protein PC120_g26054 [Phytophthora cactorum]KAG3122381.1 hypothetical protein C6341_g26991 [Phytophthora cactorum]